MTQANSDGRLAPVTVSQRIDQIDVLRGFALLGILVLNIEFFALPSVTYFDASRVGGFEGLNRLTWMFGSVFFLQKMMGMFSMLFGAGIVLMSGRADMAGQPFAGVYYRRTLWLLFFGILHGYLIWYGDILYSYAVIGLVLYFLRRRSARTLVIIGIIALGMGSLLQWGSGASMAQLRYYAMQQEARLAAGETLSEQDLNLIARWHRFEAMFAPDAWEVAAEVEAYRGGYTDNLTDRIPRNFMMQTQGFLFFSLWRAAGMMLIGMALLKWGVLSGRRSKRFYAYLALVGCGVGLPLAWFGAHSMVAFDFDFVRRFTVDNHFNLWGSALAAVGYVGVLMLLYCSGRLKGLMNRLAAVGRMAFTNYIMQSVICTSIFYGFGLGLFNRIDRFGLLLIVIGVWILQLAWSPWWLKRFRFGPFEWLWRSLTYARAQPMRIR